MSSTRASRSKSADAVLTEAEAEARIRKLVDSRWCIRHDPDSRRQEEGEFDLDVTWTGPAPQCPGTPEFELELKVKAQVTIAQLRYQLHKQKAGRVAVVARLPEMWGDVEALFGCEPGTLAQEDPGRAAGSERCVARSGGPQAQADARRRRIAELLAAGIGDTQAALTADRELREEAARVR